MANKWVDHGLYGSCSFTGYIDNQPTGHAMPGTPSGVAGSTLTVTNITSGRVSIGSEIVVNSVTHYVSALGTVAADGTGTFTLTRADTGAASSVTLGSTSLTSLYGQPLAGTGIEWGAAQDGDGSAKTAATAATISVDMTGWTFTSGSSAFTLCGASFTVGAGANSASNAQYSATLTTMIDNIVTAINTTTSSQTVVGGANLPSGWPATAKIANMFYARRTGNSLEVMTRIGGAWSGLTAMTFTNVTGSSNPTWTGGSGGAWGWLTSPRSHSLWPTGAGIRSYGVWNAVPWSGVISAGDVVKVRLGKKIWVNHANNNVYISLPAYGTAAAPVTFLLDDSTEWNTDPAFSQLFFLCDTAAYAHNFSLGNGSFINVLGKKYSNGLYQMVMKYGMLNGGSYSLGVRAESGAGKLSGAMFDATDYASGGASIVIYPTNTATVQQATFLEDCYFKMTPATYFCTTVNVSNGAKLKLRNVVFDNNNTNTANPGVFRPYPNSAALSQEYTLDGCRFVNFAPSSRLCVGYGGGIENALIRAINCQFGNVTVKGPNFGSTASNLSNMTEWVKSVTTSNQQVVTPTSLGTVVFTGSQANIAHTGPTLTVNQVVVFQTSSDLPTNITAGAVYYVKSYTPGSPGTLQISTSQGGAAVTPATSGSGTQYVFSAQAVNRDFMIDTGKGLVEWNASRTFCTRNALLDDNATRWSILMLPCQVTGILSQVTPLESIRFSKRNTLANGARTFSVAIAIQKDLVRTKKDIWLEIEYVDTGGNTVLLSSFDYAGGALTTGTYSEWSPNNGVDKVICNLTGTAIQLSPYSISLSTPTGNDLALGSEVAAWIKIATSVSNASQPTFIDPDISIV